MKGGIGWKQITLALDCDPWKLYLMFLSRETDLQLCQIYTKINIYTILYCLTRNSTNGSAVKWWRDTGGDTWPVYCSAIGDSSGHVI